MILNWGQLLKTSWTRTALLVQWVCVDIFCQYHTYICDIDKIYQHSESNFNSFLGNINIIILDIQNT